MIAGGTARAVHRHRLVEWEAMARRGGEAAGDQPEGGADDGAFDGGRSQLLAVPDAAPLRPLDDAAAGAASGLGAAGAVSVGGLGVLAFAAVAGCGFFFT